jgi:Domain of unknown function (DUF1877)
MGMESVLVQVTPSQLQEFQESPRLAYEYITGDPGEGDEFARMGAIARATFDRMGVPAHMREAVEREFRAISGIAMKPGPRLVKDQEPEAAKKQFSLEKDWHVLHYALNGTAEGGDAPLSFVVFGDKAFPDMDEVDYGPARYLTAEQVLQVSAALQSIEPESLLSKLDYEDAKKKRIYLDHTLNDLRNWAGLPQLFAEVRRFYADAAESGNGMIMKIL